MKIRKLKLENHKVFGNLEIDFTNNNQTVDTIIIAGENGCGKTQLLNIIIDTLPYLGNLVNTTRNERKYIEVQLSDSEIELLNGNDFKEFFVDKPLNNQHNILIINIDYNFTGWEQVKLYYSDIIGNRIQIKSWIIQNDSFKKILKVVFSDTEVDYTPSSIQYVTTKELDDNLSSAIRSDKNLATDIAQLFVDMMNSDAQDYSNWAEENKAFDHSKLHRRMDRFKNSFHKIFPNKHIKTIRNILGAKEIIFEENGRESTLKELSSGEKQIVFRGGFLLKNINSLKGSIVLIDEPEISLHPKWQMQIMNFYKNIFTEQSTNIQTSQIVAVTHSPFIIHNQDRSNDKVIIMKKDHNGLISVSDTPEFYSWGEQEIVKKAFNIDLSFTSNSNIVFVEGETDEQYFKQALKLKNISNIEVKWIGSYTNGNAINTGDKSLNNALSFFKSNPLFSKGKNIIFLYDSDTNKPYSKENNLHTLSMNHYSKNQKYAKGIENSLILASDFNYNDFYTSITKENSDGYGGTSTIKCLNKTQLCNHLCKNTETKSQEKIFANIFIEIEKLKNIFSSE